MSDTDTNPPRILVVEDDVNLARSLAVGLRHAGYSVLAVADGSTIEDVVQRFLPDLVFLDVALGIGPDGFAVARLIRSHSSCPILFLTAYDDLQHRLTGFDSGADDYVVKPVALAELLARVRALLRRSGRLPSLVREVRDLVLDERSRTVMRAGQPIELSPTEFSLLWTLTGVPGKVFSKLQLLTLVWGFDEFDPNLVEVYVSTLRKKLGPDGATIIKTERGRGYVFSN